jgi:hypothetical protein
LKIRTKDSYFNWLKNEMSAFQHPVAITLTLKQAIRLYRKEADKIVFTGKYLRLDENEAKKALRKFHTRLSRKILLRRDFERGVRIPLLPVIERSHSGRLHYHLVVDLAGNPITESVIRDIWSGVKFSAPEIDVKFGCDEGWLNYILKDVDKFGSEELGVDLENVSFSKRAIAA